mmetsp:Transcript_47764/g.132654  ORF Transcript_47764/g.132654 Transcript_47764/m.132654 type:complete len:106 (+) Transcript_47764:31-348(+)
MAESSSTTIAAALANLPARSTGNFSHAKSPQNHQRTSKRTGPPVYYATHDTQPPSDQVVTTERTNILLRQFQQRAEAKRQRQKRALSEQSGAAPAPKLTRHEPES